MTEKKNAITRAAVHIDSWVNAFTGLGRAGRDKVAGAQFLRKARIDDETLEAYYQGDDMAARIIEAIPREAMRPGYEIRIKQDDESQDMERVQSVEQRLWELEADSKLLKAQFWGRLFGGGALYLMVDDGVTDQAMPLNEENIKEVQSLVVLDRRELQVHTRYSKPKDPKFDEPETFRVYRYATNSKRFVGSELVVHESRLIRFFGQSQTKRQEIETDGWTYSVLSRPEEALRNFNIAWQALTHLTQDSAQAVYKLRGLIDAIAEGDKDAVLQRLNLIDHSRSVAQAIVIDSEEEDFMRHPHGLTGYGDIMDRFATRLAAAIGIPVTVLMGQAPAGLNATGESDLRLYYDSIETYRELVLRRALEKLVRILLLEDGSEPESWSLEFGALREMSEKETAELRKMVADTDAVYITTQVLTPEEVALNRYPDTGWSMETNIDLEMREKALELQPVGMAPVPTPEDGRMPANPAHPNAAPLDQPGAGATGMADPTDPRAFAPNPLDPEATDPFAGEAGAQAEQLGGGTLASEAVDPQTALNGAQVSALQGIVQSVADKLIPRETGVAMITAAFPLSPEQAEAVMGEVGRSFFNESIPDPMAPPLDPNGDNLPSNGGDNEPPDEDDEDDEDEKEDDE